LGLSFNYGSKHNRIEIPYAEYHCKQLGVKHVVIELDFMNRYFSSSLLKSGEEIPEGHYSDSSMKSTVVPFRNGIMLSIAAGMAESNNVNGIVIAAHFDDHGTYPDCRESFMKAMAEAIKQGTYNNVEIIAPFIKLKKADIAKRGAELGVDFSKTWSCYKGQEEHCGRCGTCVARKEAFKNAGMADPTNYKDSEYFCRNS
jgi:7-cyano-7-deazaguanine synthase